MATVPPEIQMKKALYILYIVGAMMALSACSSTEKNTGMSRRVHATIAFHWNNASRTLTIADREGSYPGMLMNRKFNVVLPDGTAKTVVYAGKEIKVSF